MFQQERQMAVKIVVARQVMDGCMDAVMGIIKAMRHEASHQPGFIVAETLGPLPPGREVLVITSWQSIENWNLWFDHPVRSKLQKEMDAYLEGRTEYTIYLDT
jgi:heme-degrading monooxygenase HmoA